MTVNNLPKKIAVFPLAGAVFFPKTVLPLNIFEKRYIQLVNDCMKGGKLFGMVQPKFNKGLKPEVYSVGCLGKITNFSETDDKRFIINLLGITRFKIEEELKTDKLYREFNVDYSDFIYDLNTKKDKFQNRELINKIKSLLKKNNYIVEFNKLEKLNLDQLINAICMIYPFSNQEKQKLVETIKTEDKATVLEKVINFNLIKNFESKTIQ